MTTQEQYWLTFRYENFMSRVMGTELGEPYFRGEASYPLGIEYGARSTGLNYEEQRKNLAANLGKAYTRLLEAELSEEDRNVLLGCLANTKGDATAELMLLDMDTATPIMVKVVEAR